MPNTFELIASSTLTSSASSISFSSIPSTYTDLCFKLSLRSDYATVADTMYLELNGSGVNITTKYLRGSGSAADSSFLNQFVGYADGASETANTFSNIDVYFPNYANTSYNKSYSVDSVDENNATQAYQVLIAGLWSNTAAINQVTFKLNTSRNFVANSTAYLYGVKNA